MTKFDHAAIEKKWQSRWEEDGVYRAHDNDAAPKSYVLDMFPYPSGAGLHVGHPMGYIGTDIYARWKKMCGYNVLHPMGWDAFGLPAENYAIKHGVHPRITTKQNIDNIRSQLKSLGFSYDWSREVDTTDPEYYKWTQWIFLQLYKQGLAYEAEAPINWCPKDKTGLANEEVVDGCCDRCGAPVEKRMLRQWILRITKYAERLLTELDGLDWPERIKEMQRNWIGRSEGSNVDFALKDSSEKIRVFTTRIDTIFSGAFVIVAPEHPLLQKLQAQITNWPAVEQYIKDSANKKDFERTAEQNEKTGVPLQGVTALNPANGREIPVWVSDFVLGSYGFGAVFGDAHDERDFAMAKKYNIPLTVSIVPADGTERAKIENLEQCFSGEGVLINSEQFDGLPSAEARSKITEWLAEQGKAEKTVNYKLRDWIFSRQRYWGEPIPMIHCPQCGTVPVPEEQLPVLLPEVEKYEPTGTGESPLANISEWVNTGCPRCGGAAKRETNTMPQWAGSSWYFLRFTDPHNTQAFAQAKNLSYWMPVDTYVGGAEHAVLHLLYARFWIKALQDAGHVHFSEPFTSLRNQGLILAADGTKMSKSKGNTVTPDEVIAQYGADSMRLYEMFMGPFEDAKPWSTESIRGIWRFVQRVWSLLEVPRLQSAPEGELRAAQHRTIKKISEDIPAFKFNTAVSTLMQYANTLAETRELPQESLEVLVQLLSPFAPHLAAEMWEQLGHSDHVVLAHWPAHDERYIAAATVEIPVQINGKVRGKVSVAAESTQDAVVAAARAIENVQRYLEQGAIQKIVYVPGKLLSLVVR